MDEVFVRTSNDKGLSILLKREANIVLASLNKGSNEYLYMKKKYEEALFVIKAIEATEPQNENDIDFILDTVYKIWDTGILSPLTLKRDEFSNIKDPNGYFRNNRYPDIYIDPNNYDSICNDNAFNLKVRAIYNHNENRQLSCEGDTIYKNHKVYISKGGFITGEYLDTCIIRPDVVSKHAFTIQSVINIPISIIIDKGTSIYVVDHREPKLKVLRMFYIVPIGYDKDVEEKRYDIRKYNKLK